MRSWAKYVMPAVQPRWTLVVAVVGSSMAFLDSSVVAVALPVMQRELSMSVRLAQWIVESYSLMLAALVLVGGALGDRLGRRRVYVAGVVLFAIASAACGLAPSAFALVVARGVQGVGAALLVPGSLALISAAYPERARGGAIGTWSALSAITVATAPVAGGWIVAHGSWRWLFFFNVPLAAIVVVLSHHVVETRDQEAAPTMDWAGAALATLGLGLVVYALVDAGAAHSGRMLALFALGLLTLAVFVVVEVRGPAPMVHVSLFRSRTFLGANLLTLLLYAALGGAFFFLPFDLIQVQGYSPSAAGAALIPFVVLLAGLSRGMGAVVSHIGARPLLVAGPLIASVGVALLARPTIGGGYWTTFFPAIVVLGVGVGITVAPLTVAVMGAVESRHAGVASGINNAVARTAGLLAIAALGAVLTTRFDAIFDAHLARVVVPATVAAIVATQRPRLADADLSAVTDPTLATFIRGALLDAYIAAFREVMLVCAGLAALGAALAGVLVEGKSRRGHPSRG